MHALPPLPPVAASQAAARFDAATDAEASAAADAAAAPDEPAPRPRPPRKTPAARATTPRKPAAKRAPRAKKAVVPPPPPEIPAEVAAAQFETAAHVDDRDAIALAPEPEAVVSALKAALPAKLQGWRAEARLTTWLYRVAVNAAHDRRRRAASHARAALGWGDWERGRQADIAAEAEAQDWLTAAMAQLSDELRDTVALTLGEGLSQAEVLILVY